MRGFLGAAIRSFTGRILGALSALAASYAVTQKLSVAESGVFFLALGFAIFFSHTLRFGLDNFVLKKCAIFLSDGDLKAFLSTVLASALICISVSGLLYLLLHGVAEFSHYEYMQHLLAAYPAAIAVALMGIIAHSLHASGYVFTGTFTNTSLHFITVTALIWFVDPDNASEAIKLFTFSCYTALLIQLVVATSIFSAKGIGLDVWQRLQLYHVDYTEIYRTTVPLWIVVIAQQLNQWGGQFISSIYITEEEIALLAIAMRIALLVPMVLTAVNMVVSPRFAEHYHKGEIQKTEDVLAKSLMLLSVVSVAVFLLMLIADDYILSTFGDQYVGAGVLLTILVSGQLVNALTGPCGKLLMMSGHEKTVRNSSVVVTVIGLCFAYYLTANHGVLGAAIATSLTIAVQNIAFAFWVYFRLDINLLRVYSKMIPRLST